MLQTFDDSNFPLQKYIIDVETVIGSPRYLNPQLSLENANQPESIPIDVPQWCDEDVMGLDEFQIEALKAAVTKQLAVIQGPPG